MKKLLWIILIGAAFAFYWFALRKDKTALAGGDEIATKQPNGTIVKGFGLQELIERPQGTIMSGLPWLPKPVIKTLNGIRAFIRAEITEGTGFICPKIGKILRPADRPYIAQVPFWRD